MNRDLIHQIVTYDPIPHHLGDGGPWLRVYARNSPQGVEMVYEGSAGAADARAVFMSGDGNCPVVRTWQDDAALPTLGWLRKRHADAVPVRYRPGKRCTLRKGSLFLKCVADDRGCGINSDARLLWRAGRDGFLDFGVARPAGWLPSLRMIAQHRVPGAPVADRLWSMEGAALARRLGEANASLAKAPLNPPTRFTYVDQLKRTAKYSKRLAQWVPGAEAILRKIQAQLITVEPGPADRAIHGAPHAHQWLDGPDGPMLVDFDRFSLGDPELDAATFAAEADFEASPYAHTAGEAYLAGYDSVFPLNSRLVLAYRAHKHVAKALRTATAIRLDAAERALEILEGANRLMEQRP